MMLVNTESRVLERWLLRERKKNEMPCWAVGCRMNTVKDIRLALGGRALPASPQTSTSLQDLVHDASVVLARSL